MTATDLDLHRRAAARCTVSEPHRDAGEDWPCRRCVAAVQVQLAIASDLSAPASNPVAGGSPASAGAGFDGASGRVPGTPAAESPAGDSTSAMNNRREAQLPAAEGATAIARNEGT